MSILTITIYALISALLGLWGAWSIGRWGYLKLGFIGDLLDARDGTDIFLLSIAWPVLLLFVIISTPFEYMYSRGRKQRKDE